MLDLYGLTQKYFGDQGPEVVDMMYNIALAESGGNPNAYNGVGLDNSHGLWQINVHPEANPDLAGMNLNDPEQNAQAARIIYDRQGPQAWSTYGTVVRGVGGGGKKSSGVGPRQIADGVINSLMENKPELSDFKDLPYDPQTGAGGPAIDQYEMARMAWKEELDTMLAVRDSYAEEEAGIFRMEDGMIITREQMDSLDPTSRAQVESYIANKNIERDNQFNQILNELDLTEFTTGQNSSVLENQRRSTDFQNQLESIREGINLDIANQDTAVRKIDRNLKGMQEASTRASTALDALLKAAPWGTTNGKTSFSPADLGGAVASMAKFGGIGANDPLMNFTGTLNIDPNSMFNFYDQQLGVTGPLPQVPDLDPRWAGMIPQAPETLEISQQMPNFRRPQAPAQTPLPQSSPLPPLPEIALPMLQSILGIYRGGLR